MKRTLSEDAWLASIGKNRGVAIRILDVFEEMLESKGISIPDERGIYGRSIPPEAGSQRRTGQGQERKGKEIEETGCGCQPAVGWRILTDTMKAMTPNAPWPILFC